MTTYYNEFDPHAAAWLRELIKAGQIADGDVDERSISEVTANDVKGYTQQHFFAGIGGWSLAARLAGWPDDKPLFTGSPPCQPFSTAGKHLGTADERHLAPHWLELVRTVRPPFVAGEQVASAINKDSWLDDLLDALEAENYATGAIVLPASFIGAPHIRQRIFFVGRMGDVGNAGLQRHREPGVEPIQEGREGKERYNSKTVDVGGMANAERNKKHEEQQRPTEIKGERRPDKFGGCGMDDSSKPTNAHQTGWGNPDWLFCRDGKWRPVESGTFPMVNGLPRGVVYSGDPCEPSYTNKTSEARVMRLKGYGNAIVPQVAAEVLKELLQQ